MNPIHLFEFAKTEIPGVTCFYVNSLKVDEISETLQTRFSKSPKFKGTPKKHQFVPHDNDIVMKRVSGSTGIGSTLIYNGHGLQLESITPGSFYACCYENDWYFGIANFVSTENQDVNVKFLHPKGPAIQFFWPSRDDDICWIPISNIICNVQAPKSSATGRFYHFLLDDINLVKDIIQ